MTTQHQLNQLALAISQAQQLQATIARAGMPATPTYYKLTAIRETLERRLKKSLKSKQPPAV